MLRQTRPILCLVLCLLVISWGTSPCVFARALDLSIGDGQQGEQQETSCVDCCCKQESSDGGPGECPVCESGGSIRDLPPQGAAIALDPADAPAFLDAPADHTVLASMDAPTTRSARGPPDALALHACPVGIVRILS